ncbi:hypothetical protein P170DRAFT_425600 [Aspergillus steynii IBT 23096]|uniref:Uncharacterized protein n=1 Tax=Aspergillus steynii IBT 23096 TaxID=1392250 RepID=A0A2I2GEW5_9EURO|nr:uncharacterized protein P170DRAFT_425600 [Aspergillus steynii IBT 23096]PLB51367.1 hypothetical protein P170DRAFT_425600 [Aspergillus steynii IBT 23096]
MSHYTSACEGVANKIIAATEISGDGKKPTFVDDLTWSKPLKANMKSLAPDNVGLADAWMVAAVLNNKRSANERGSIWKHDFDMNGCPKQGRIPRGGPVIAEHHYSLATKEIWTGLFLLASTAFTSVNPKWQADLLVDLTSYPNGGRISFKQFDTDLLRKDIICLQEDTSFASFAEDLRSDKSPEPHESAPMTSSVMTPLTTSSAMDAIQNLFQGPVKVEELTVSNHKLTEANKSLPAANPEFYRSNNELSFTVATLTASNTELTSTIATLSKEKGPLMATINSSNMDLAKQKQVSAKFASDLVTLNKENNGLQERLKEHSERLDDDDFSWDRTYDDDDNDACFTK